MSAFDGASSTAEGLRLSPSSTDAGAMTSEERARHIHKVLCDHAKARSKPFTLWAELAPAKQQRLIAAAERLQSEYESAGDPPSRGLAAVARCSECKQVVVPGRGHLCAANHEKHCAIRTTRDGWDADCSCRRGLP